MSSVNTLLQPVRLRVRQCYFKVRDEAPFGLTSTVEIKGESINLTIQLGLNVPSQIPHGSPVIGLVVTIGIDLSPRVDDPRSASNTFENIKLVSDAFFVLPIDIPPDSVNEDLLLNCFNILYGAMRGQLQVLTSHVPGTFIVLPGVDMRPIFRGSELYHQDHIAKIRAHIQAGPDKTKSPPGPR